MVRQPLQLLPLPKLLTVPFLPVLSFPGPCIFHFPPSSCLLFPEAFSPCPTLVLPLAHHILEITYVWPRPNSCPKSWILVEFFAQTSQPESSSISDPLLSLCVCSHGAGR